MEEMKEDEYSQCALCVCIQRDGGNKPNQCSV
jgi:hypothetical protein